MTDTSATEKITCKRCAFADSRIGARFCERCGYTLFDDLSTRKLDDEALDPNPTWGTLKFGESRKLRLEIGKMGETAAATVNVVLASELLLGRFPNPTRDILDLTPYNAQALGVSRRHGALARVADSLTYRDLGSANGSFLNGARLERDKYTPVAEGNTITLGSMAIRVYFI